MNNIGLKENNNKLLTLEVDAEFIEKMMKVMTDNKVKYPRFNHYKDIDPILLFEAMERHLLEAKMVIQEKIKKGEPITDVIDETDNNSHIVKIATNAMMFWIQVNKNNVL